MEAASTCAVLNVSTSSAGSANRATKAIDTRIQGICVLSGFGCSSVYTFWSSSAATTKWEFITQVSLPLNVNAATGSLLS